LQLAGGEAFGMGTTGTASEKRMKLPRYFRLRFSWAAMFPILSSPQLDLVVEIFHDALERFGERLVGESGAPTTFNTFPRKM
jgi:hypothetical protein